MKLIRFTGFLIDWLGLFLCPAGASPPCMCHCWELQRRLVDSLYKGPGSAQFRSQAPPGLGTPLSAAAVQKLPESTCKGKHDHAPLTHYLGDRFTLDLALGCVCWAVSDAIGTVGEFIKMSILERTLVGCIHVCVCVCGCAMPWKSEDNLLYNQLSPLLFGSLGLNSCHKALTTNAFIH